MQKVSRTFSILAPDAISVLLVGDFTDKWRIPVRLSRGGGGLWSTTIEVQPGLHSFWYILFGSRKESSSRRSAAVELAPGSAVNESNCHRFTVSNQPISEKVTGFISRHIQSVEQLEILCLFVENPGQTWSEEEIYRSLQRDRASVASKLRLFASQKIIALDSTGRYRLNLAGADLGATVTDLVKAYRERPVAVIESIYTRRSDPVRNFAD